MIPPPDRQPKAGIKEETKLQKPIGPTGRSQVVGMIPPPDCQLEAGLEIVTPSYFLIHAHGQSASGRLSQVMG